MQIKETIGVSFPGSVESPPLEDVVVLVDSAGVALGVQRAFSARVRGVRDGGSGIIASRCVESFAPGAFQTRAAKCLRASIIAPGVPPDPE
jgi:hypothetical protein